MVRIARMVNQASEINRRELCAGLATAALTPALAASPAMGWQNLVLRARAERLALDPGIPPSTAWTLSGPDLRFRRGDSQSIAFGNDLPAKMVLNWRGIDGIAAAEPLLTRQAIAPGASDAFEVRWPNAGSYLCDLALLGDDAAQPTRGLPVIIAETEPIAVDRDEVILIEEWRLRADGTAIAPGRDPAQTMPIYTVNGLTTASLAVRRHERLRLRFMNGCQRAILAFKVDQYDVRVMALDGQPSEPFSARNGTIVLAPGGRADAFIDASAASGSNSSIRLYDGKTTRVIATLTVSEQPAARDVALPIAAALPVNGLPAELDLGNAMRFELMLGGPRSDWSRPTAFNAANRFAFAAKLRRTAVLALINPADTSTIFHLHGHHFRLLDRLDDGWKPFWLDTLAIAPHQTQRIAFIAEHAGHWLLEAVGADWAAPRLVKWYSVD